MTSPSRSNNTWWLLLFLLILQLTSSLCRSIGWDDENKDSDIFYDDIEPSTTENNKQTTDLESEVQRLSVAVERTYEALEELKTEIEHEPKSSKHGHRSSVPKMQCRSAHTLWHGAVGKTLEYLDNFDVHCRGGEFLRQWRMTWGERENGLKQIRYVCCKFVSHREEKSHRRKSSDTD